jgi:hypothetical protein
MPFIIPVNPKGMNPVRKESYEKEELDVLINELFVLSFKLLLFTFFCFCLKSSIYNIKSMKNAIL